MKTLHRDIPHIVTYVSSSLACTSFLIQRDFSAALWAAVALTWCWTDGVRP